MLQNRIYRGETTHNGKSYPGEHPAIIDQPLWDEVQAVLAQNRVERATGARAKHPSLLGGFVIWVGGELGRTLRPAGRTFCDVHHGNPRVIQITSKALLPA